MAQKYSFHFSAFSCARICWWKCLFASLLRSVCLFEKISQNRHYTSTCTLYTEMLTSMDLIRCLFVKSIMLYTQCTDSVPLSDFIIILCVGANVINNNWLFIIHNYPYAKLFVEIFFWLPANQVHSMSIRSFIWHQCMPNRSPRYAVCTKNCLLKIYEKWKPTLKFCPKNTPKMRINVIEIEKVGEEIQ